MDKEKLQEVADELFIALTEEETRVLLEAFTYFNAQAKLLANIPGVDDVEPLVFPFDVKTYYLREDEVSPSPSKSEILKNSHNSKDGYVIIPKVVK